MYSQKNKTFSLDKWIKDNNDQLNIFNALKDKKYKIFISFNQYNEAIKYEAIINESEKTLPDYLAVEILPNGTPSPHQTVLFAYIFECEKKLTNDELKQIYRNIYSCIENNIIQPHPLLEERLSTRKDFYSLLNDLSFSSSQELDSEIDLILNINTHQSPYTLSLKIKKDKAYVIQSIGEFLSTIREEEYFSYTPSFGFVHTLSSFTPKAQKIISFLSQTYIYSSKRDKEIVIYKSSFIDLLFLLKDCFIVLNDEEYYIDPVYITPNIEINKDDVVITPLLLDEQYSNNSKTVVIDHQTGIINLIQHKNKSYQKLYTFISENKGFKWEHVSDLLLTKLNPILSNKETTSHDLNKVASLEINLYLDLTSNDTLIVKTSYVLGGNESTKGEIIQNIRYFAKVEKYLNLLAQLKLEDNCTIYDHEVIYNILKNDLSELKKVCKIYLSENLKQKDTKNKLQLNINATYDIDWLNLNLQNSKYTIKEIQAILKSYNLKKKFYLLKNDIVFLDDENLEPLNNLFNTYKIKDTSFTLPLYEIFNISSLDNSFNLTLDNKITEIISDIKNYSDSDFVPNNRLKSLMKPYQINAYKWLNTLHKHKLGGILADDMGLGKTLEMISFITTLSTSKPILIVTPKSLLYNWENEFKTWSPETKIKIIVGNKTQRTALINEASIKSKTVFITSYDSLRNDIDLYQNCSFSLMILDEAQYIKNVSTQKTQATKEIVADSRFVLTGTPIENSLSDLWSLFDFLMPGYLGSYQSFKKNYQNLIATSDNETTKKRLLAKIKPFILRRTKEEVLNELPPKTETIKMLTMEERQENLYNAYLEKIKLTLNDKSNKIDILASLTRLRQLCIDPYLFIDNYTGPSIKIETCLNLIHQAIQSGHKVIIFSSFTKALEQLNTRLKKELINAYYIHGQVDAQTRLDYSNEFNNLHSTKVMLVSIKAGGTGLNLTGGDIVIHLDPWWNIATENQATDRTHRIGQTKPVTVIKLICKNSIEEKVLLLQNLKKNLSNDFILHGENIINSIDDEDIKYLLS